MSLTLALGVVIGIYPLIGTATLACFAIAYQLKLNIPLIQAAHFAVSPLAVLLSIPFLRFGETILRLQHVPISPHALIKTLLTNPLVGFKVVFCALIGWMVFALPLGICIYFASKPLMKHVLDRFDLHLV